MARVRSKVGFAVCIDNTDCEDLEIGTVYVIRPDASAKREGYVRVVDESGEDYLYPESYFVSIDLPDKARDALARHRVRAAEWH
jgi:hypothetical protein